MRRRPLLAMLALAVIGDVGHRARAIQRDGGNQVLQPVRAHLAQHVTHPRTLKLKHPAGIAAGQHGVGGRIIQGQTFQIHGDVEVAQKFHRALQDGERGKAEEIEFHQPGLFHPFHVILRHQRVFTRITVHRHKVDKFAITDHHPGRMRAGMAVQTLHLHGDFEKPLY